MANIVAIVGRPNVGKSTLFNRFVEQKKAIVDDHSGVTRDRHYGICEWGGQLFTVVDTGGYVENSDDIFEKEIKKQVLEALNEATVVLFLVDTQLGLHILDEEFAKVLRVLQKPVLLVANKVDNYEVSQNVSEFWALGIKSEIFNVSSATGSGTGDLLDAVVSHFELKDDENVIAEENKLPRIAILGRPNVGKSSFLNVLLGRDRNIVTDIAGTTRDSIDSIYNLFGKTLIITDTAGIRKKSKVKEDLEFYSVLRALQALQNSDVCIIMVDAEQGLESQDVNLLSLANKYKKGAMIMINKWDLIEKETNKARDIENEIKNKLGQLNYVPIVFASVLQKQRVFKVIEMAGKIYENKFRHIPTSQLNEKLLPEIAHTPPPAVRGKHIKIKYITQLPTKSPAFAFFCNHPKDVQEPYKRFLINKIRSHFEFDGVPVTIVLKQK